MNRFDDMFLSFSGAPANSYKMVVPALGRDVLHENSHMKTFLRYTHARFECRGWHKVFAAESPCLGPAACLYYFSLDPHPLKVHKPPGDPKNVRYKLVFLIPTSIYLS